MADKSRRQGWEAEEEFERCTGFSQTDESKDGDFYFAIGNRNYIVEVKQISTGASGTLNQLRPMKYLTTAIWVKDQDAWYVVPPQSLVALAAKKTRGHHGENPFENMSASIAAFRKGFKVEDPACEHLGDKVREAAVSGDRYRAIRQEMTKMQAKVTELADTSKEAVTSRIAKAKTTGRPILEPKFVARGAPGAARRS